MATTTTRAWAAQCCARVTGTRFTLTPPRPHQSFEPILSRSFWIVKDHHHPTPPAFHTLAGQRLQKASAIGEATSSPSVSRGTATGVSSSSKKPLSQQHQHQHKRDGADLTSKIEDFLSRSGRRRPMDRQRPSSSVGSSTASSSSLPFRRESKKKRYLAAFQAGDFMCPRCGTHNFGDPDKHLRPFMARSIPQRSPSSSSPSPPPSSHRSSEPHRSQDKSSSHSSLPQKSQEDSVEIGSALKAPPLGTRERRKRVQGAISTCIECGYSTQGTVEGVGSATAPRTTTNKHDERLSRSREYVCVYCDTVNFGGRISCVGCGAIMSSLRDCNKSVA